MARGEWGRAKVECMGGVPYREGCRGMDNEMANKIPLAAGDPPAAAQEHTPL